MSKKRQRQRKKGKAQATEGIKTPEHSRRDAMRLIRNGAIGAAALGGAGWWFASGVKATAAEHDLTRLGQGQPAIVQIHDPQCPRCTQLQRATRRALKCFDEEEVLYLVANIRTDAGSAFAASLGLPHVTLVLMDGRGAAQNVLQGVRERDELKEHFQAFLGTA
jgi:thioredoxin-like negative regulator of GroEL